MPDPKPLEAARALPEVLDALARHAWWTRYKTEPDKREACPSDMIPSEADLVEWLPECPESGRQESAQLVEAMLSPPAQLLGLTFPFNSKAKRQRPSVVFKPVGLLQNTEPVIELSGKHLGVYVVSEAMTWGHLWQLWMARPNKSFPVPDRTSLETLHWVWRTLPAQDRPRHFLAPLVQAWQRRPVPGRDWKLTSRAYLPGPMKRDENLDRLPDFPRADTPPQPKQKFLWSYMEPAVTRCPSWLLWLFDRVGGVSMSAGRGAPWEMRLFIGALLHLAVPDRDGNWRIRRFPTTDVIKWLHPNGWENQRRDWHRFPEALDRMARDLGWVPVPGIGRVAMIFPSVIPEKPSDPLVEFMIRLPASGAKGARMDWPRLCLYGTKSAGLYRAYLSAAALLERSAHRGMPITQTIGKPLLLPDGRPRRRKGGALVRSRTEREPNPAAQFQPVLSNADLATMIGFNAGTRKQRFAARKHFEQLHADGVIRMGHHKGGVQLFGPDGELLETG